MAERRGWHSVRIRLLVLALLPMLVLMPLLLGITMQRWVTRTDQILLARVGSDLTVGREYLAHLVDNTWQQIDAFGASAAYLGLPVAGREDALTAARDRLGLDFLLPADHAAVARFGTGAARRGIVVLTATELARIAPELATRATITLAGGGSETRGMMVLAAAPAPGGTAAGTGLVGGVLLNGNTGFIDRINDLVYPAASPAHGAAPDLAMDRGITTLFLDDIRISTTLRPTGDGRALGTRASAGVAAQVLGEGLPWRDTALVVNDWYISAYEAITDLDGVRAGMLYTGFPKAPYTQARQVTLLLVGAAFAGVLALFIPLALHWARGIFRPVEAMGQTIARVEGGDMTARTGQAPGAQELTHLAGHLDQLLGRLAQREQALNTANQDLNDRVAARTADLLAANQALAAATQQLVLAARLATIGEVTAGVAHEINNPLAVISGNLEVLRIVLAERQPEAETELQLIEDQIRRIGALVSQLLQFARPDEFAAGPATTDLVQVITGTRPLVRHLLTPGRIRLDEDLTASRPVGMGAAELQQVVVNLIANAAQAMPDGGRILVTCHDADALDGQPGVAVTLQDNGPGMPPEITSRVFDPFFTTRGRDGGTGLGLAICQNLITRAGGELTVSSQPGMGSTFRIWLPAAV